MHQRRNHIILSAAAMLAVTASLAHAAGETGIRALLGDGTWTRAQLVSIGGGEWKVADDAGTERVILESEVIAFIVDRARATADPQADTEVPSPISYGSLEFTNGQRLPGSFRATRDANLWDHRWIGAVPLDLEQIATLRVRGARTPDRRAEGDTILLLNGDALTGFVEKLGEDVEFEPLADADAADAKPERRTVSMDRIAAISLAKSEAPRAAALRIWAVDGSLVDATALRYDGRSGWGFNLADPLLAKVRHARTGADAPPSANPIAGLLRGEQLVPLASAGKPALSVPAEHHHFGSDRAVRVGSTERALLGLASIELAGPIVARFPRPAALDGVDGSVVFSCEIALAEPAPRDARVDVEIRIGSGASARCTLDGARRRVPITIEQRDLGRGAESGQLEITVTDGGNGIAGDAIMLERACFIVLPRR